MKMLGKLQIKPEKLLKDVELLRLKGGMSIFSCGVFSADNLLATQNWMDYTEFLAEQSCTTYNRWTLDPDCYCDCSY